MDLPAKSSVIVLHYLKYGDSGLVLHVLDSEQGRTSLLLRGLGKGKSSPDQGSIFNLSILDVVTYDSPKASMSNLREYEPKVALNEIRTDLNKSVIALFISELLYRSIKDGDGDRELFEWLCEAIVRLDAEEGSCANFHLWFLVEYSRKLGFLPRDNFNAENCFFDIVSARYIDRNTYRLGESKQFFPQQESALLHIISTSTPEEVMALPLTGQQRSDFAARCIDFLSYHLETPLNVKSLSVLHEIFS